MNLVQQAWGEGNPRREQALLRTHIPKPGERDLRGFEWRYLWQLCQDESLHTVRYGTNDPIWKLATSPAHSFLAACGEKTLRLLDAATGRDLLSFSYPNPEAMHKRYLIALASGATNLLAAHRADGVVGLWDLPTKTLLMTFRPFTNQLGSLALSPDGRFLAAGDALNRSRALTLW